MSRKSLDPYKGVTIPQFDFAILASAEDVVSVRKPFDACYSVIMSKDALMDISKVKPPDFHVPICAASYQECGVG